MHVVVVPLSHLWWLGFLSSVIAIVLLLLMFKKRLQAHQLPFMKALSIMLVFSLIYGHQNALFIAKSWCLQYNLPLHLFRIYIFIELIALWNPKQWMYQWLLFLSIPSGIQSILTPEFTQAISTYLIFDYYLIDTALILILLFLTYNRGMLPRIDAWKKSFFNRRVALVNNRLRACITTSHDNYLPSICS